jgi:hypothetical protein
LQTLAVKALCAAVAEGVERQRLDVSWMFGQGWSGELRVKAPSCDGAAHRPGAARIPCRCAPC